MELVLCDSTQMATQRNVEKQLVLNLLSLIHGWGYDQYIKAFRSLPVFVSDVRLV